MVFNSSRQCEKLIRDCASQTEEDDQIIVNKVALNKYYNYIALLNEDLFPNGHVYYKENRKENAVIVHNNWMIGVDTKIQHFKDENLWYL
jgi:transposase